MVMTIPKFHETFGPILEVLSNGKTIHTRTLLNEVVSKYYAHLPAELLNERTKTGEVLLHNRIAWGKSYLKKGGYIEFPARGYVKITEKGLNRKRDPSLSEMTDESGLQGFYTPENAKTESRTGVSSSISSATPQDLIDSGFQQLEVLVKADLRDRILKSDPFYFQKIILLLLEKMGYGKFIETPKTSDGGIDGIVNEDTLGLDKIYIQAKRFTQNKVRETDVRDFIGAMSGDTYKGVFVTTSKFDQGAIQKAKAAHHKIILIDGDQLVDLMHTYCVGVQVKSSYEVKQIDEDFFQES